MFWDTHMHCSFSGDCDSSPQSMIEAAIAKGLAGICFTDHMDYDYPPNPDHPIVFTFDLHEYGRTMRELQSRYADRLPVLYGVELGLQPHLAQKHRQLLQNHSFDFVIGSSHIVDGKDPYYASYYVGRTEQAAYERYFLSIHENIRAFQDFDVYGHIDYVVRYGPNKNTFYSYRKYADIIDEILKLLIELGKGIEVNTAGFKYGLGHPNPCEDILKRYRELGGEILTLGADAHKPEQIAYDFDRLPQLLTACGFSYYTVFKNRKAEFISLKKGGF